AVDGEGNCYSVGSFSSGDSDFGGAILASRGGYDGFVAKFDPLGNLVWVKQAGGTQYDIAFGIGLDVAANCYIAGVRDGSASFDSIQMADVGFNTTFFLAKIVELPALNLAFVGQQAFLYWPANKSDFSLESSPDLSSNASWTAVTSPFVVLGDQRVVIDDLKAGKRFYRLKE
ncbi:MAG TPA: hypothetical protein VN887_15465, partial [Candidatus Angelobacter sp.]|nr:hypothetical protein [Candidatus Angelobacter sp.]